MSMTVVREFCAENFTLVPAAIEAGARRIELCDNLAVGGTTPSAGVIRATVSFAHAHETRVMTMIRPRGGDFVMTPEELEMMVCDLELACQLGTDGVVFGCLVRDGEGYQLDTAALDALMDAVRRMEGERASAGGEAHIDVTFHMAFDELEPDAQLSAIDTLADAGVTRVLTHGGAAGTAIEDNLDHLAELVEHAQGKLAILPGAGISYLNAPRVVDALGVGEVHGTKIVDLS